MFPGLTDERRMIRDLAAEFARREIRPAAARHDRESLFPAEIERKAREVGLVNLTAPEAYGGAGLGILDLVLVTEELAWACVGITTAMSLNALPVDVLLVAGDEEQRRRGIGRIVSDGEFASYAVTEPAAGSDVAGIKARAERRGDDYVLNGSKVWITNASVASFFTVFAKTDPAAGHRGISAFLVERDAPGLSVGNPLPKLGQKAAPACEMFMNDVVVPKGARLGAEGDGFRIAMKVFDRSRPMVAALGVGLLSRCLDESIAYACDRRTMGVPIIEHQAVAHKIAEMGMRAEAARLLTRQAAALVDGGARSTLQASYAKAFAADGAMWAAVEAVQIFGGMGYSTEYPAEKLLRDAKGLQIYEGTSEIQRNIIARELARR